MDAPSPQPPCPPRQLRDHLVAIFVPLHMLMVLLYVAPNPPRMDKAALNHPDVAQELGFFIHDLHGLINYQGSEEALKEEVIEWVRAYDRSYDRVRAVADTYLRPLGLRQSWLMFAGTPPRHPRVMVVEVRPRGEAAFVTWLDGRWGEEGDERFNFRHRKVQNKLSIAGNKKRRREYAQYWARQWDGEHPDRPAEAIRLSYLELHTRTAAQVRAEAPERPPDRRVEFTWRRDGEGG